MIRLLEVHQISALLLFRASPTWMRDRGWVRHTRGAMGKGGTWKHRGGWGLVHCGHPTALWPWTLVQPNGHLVLSGVLAGHPPNCGRAWSNLALPVAWYERFLETGEELDPPKGKPHVDLYAAEIIARRGER